MLGEATSLHSSGRSNKLRLIVANRKMDTFIMKVFNQVFQVSVMPEYSGLILGANVVSKPARVLLNGCNYQPKSAYKSTKCDDHIRRPCKPQTGAVTITISIMMDV